MRLITDVGPSKNQRKRYFSLDASVRIEATDPGRPGAAHQILRQAPFALDRLHIVGDRSDQILYLLPGPDPAGRTALSLCALELPPLPAPPHHLYGDLRSPRLRLGDPEEHESAEDETYRPHGFAPIPHRSLARQVFPDQPRDSRVVAQNSIDLFQLTSVLVGKAVIAEEVESGKDWAHPVAPILLEGGSLVSSQ